MSLSTLVPSSQFNLITRCPRALSADVLLLNEIGLDPGIDHCSAHAVIKRLHSQGKRIVSFISFCGGLPAPECADVPLGYKFSWSPKGVLTAALNSARFRLGGGKVSVGRHLEWYSNRSLILFVSDCIIRTGTSPQTCFYDHISSAFRSRMTYALKASRIGTVYHTLASTILGLLPKSGQFSVEH